MKRIISGFLTLVMLLGSLVVSADAAWADKVNEKGDPIIDYLSKDYATSEDKLADMTLVKEQNGKQLYYEEFTGDRMPYNENPHSHYNGQRGPTAAAIVPIDNFIVAEKQKQR
jgi:hypothetical protein